MNICDGCRITFGYKTYEFLGRTLCHDCYRLEQVLEVRKKHFGTIVEKDPENED